MGLDTIIAIIVSICTLFAGINLVVFSSINSKVKALFCKYDDMVQRLSVVETKLEERERYDG